MLDSKNLAELKEKLQIEKERLETELASFAKKRSEPGHYDAKWEDYGDDEEENAAEVAAYTDSLGLEQTLESELAEVDAALLRMENHDYGICISCGQEIDSNRLFVRPQSALCMSCA